MPTKIFNRFLLALANKSAGIWKATRNPHTHLPTDPNSLMIAGGSLGIMLTLLFNLPVLALVFAEPSQSRSAFIAVFVGLLIIPLLALSLLLAAVLRRLILLTQGMINLASIASALLVLSALITIMGSNAMNLTAGNQLDTIIIKIWGASWFLASIFALKEVLDHMLNKLHPNYIPED